MTLCFGDNIWSAGNVIDINGLNYRNAGFVIWFIRIYCAFILEEVFILDEFYFCNAERMACSITLHPTKVLSDTLCIFTGYFEKV